MTRFSKELESSFHRVNEALEHYLSTLDNQYASLVEAMRYSSLLGGKRIRPFLVYYTGQMLGIEAEALDAPASAVECIHAYSLIHDDLPAMDNDVIRRDQEACHVKFGESTAILAGNALQSLAFNILADADMPKVSLQNRLRMISTLADASGANGICLGQALDLKSNRKKVSFNQLKTIYRYKTSALIRAATRIGALAAYEQSVSILDYLDHFADSIGLVFQMQDDAFDIIHDEKIIAYKQAENQRSDKNVGPVFIKSNVVRDKVKKLYHRSLACLKQISLLGFDTTKLIDLARYIIKRER